MAEPESAPVWRSSGRCDSGACVEVASVGTKIAVRDSKDPDGPVLLFSHAEWTAFVAAARAGDFQFD